MKSADVNAVIQISSILSCCLLCC